MDGTEWILGLLALLLVAMLGFSAYDAIFVETFELRKDQWTCTNSRTEMTMTTTVAANGSVVSVPSTQAVCVKYERR